MESQRRPSRRILVRVRIAEALHAESRLEIEQRAADFVGLGRPPGRGEAGGEEPEIGRVVRALGPGPTTPHHSVLVVSAGVAGKTEGRMRKEEMRVEW